MATIPPGVSSDGMTRVWFVPALADTSAPTVAEITAGFDITCYLTTDGFKVGGSQEKGEDARLCSPQVFETAGRFKPTVEPLVYVFDPQDPTNTSLANAAYKELTMGRKGYLVYRMGMAFDTALASTQKVWIDTVTMGAQLPLPPEANGKFKITQEVITSGNRVRDVTVAA